MRRGGLAFALALAGTLAACGGEPTARGEGPPLTIASASPSASDSVPVSAPLPVPDPVPAPVEAKFVTVTASPTPIPLLACHQALVADVKGTMTAGGQALSAGDVLATTAGPLDLRGDGLAVVATMAVTPCTVPLRLVPATAAPQLTFLGGAMRAHLDLDDRAVAPAAYLGRLAGNAPVPEHVHDKSWEILCAVEAAGTFTLAGVPQRLGARTCVAVPPGTKHAWQPDAGSTLGAVQIYAPPGPEQRFKKLAAEGK
jgi:mannose-6-phosphate isomerase-like protein (cupin superfamily)